MITTCKFGNEVSFLDNKQQIHMCKHRHGVTLQLLIKKELEKIVTHSDYFSIKLGLETMAGIKICSKRNEGSKSD